MKITKEYQLDRWTEWNYFLAVCIEDFIAAYSFSPNILEANVHTYSQIDFLINVIPGEKDKLKSVYTKSGINEKPGEDEEVGINSFQHAKALLDFAIDNSLTDKEIKLIYDSNPEWEDKITSSLTQL